MGQHNLALQTTVFPAGVQKRYPREIESAAYFCCLEALQNAAKHARGATVVVIEITDNGVLRFEVRDDGEGFDASTAPVGVGHEHARPTGRRGGRVGGGLLPWQGTRVLGRIPLEV